MALSKSEQFLYAEAEEIARISQMNFWDVEDLPKSERKTHLELSIRHMVTAAVVSHYTLLDDVLAEIICRYYFPAKRKRYALWKKESFRVFVTFLLDEIYLLKKLETVHALRLLPGEVRSIIQKANALRNSLAHSFFPENRKEHSKAGKVLYGKKDINTAEGLGAFQTDCSEAFNYLARRVYGEWLGVKEGEGKWDIPPGTASRDCADTRDRLQ